MQLVNSYLAEVEQHLPSKLRSDIVGELRDDITEQLNDLAEQAGRAPDVTDERAVLSRLGHPLKVASSFSSRAYLIGPGLYPAYLKTLRTSLGLVLAIALLVWIAVGSESSGTYAVKGLFGPALSIAFWVVVAVTLVFLSLEASGEKLGWYHHWSPDQLKVGRSPLNFSDLVTNLLTEGFFLLLWNSLLSIGWASSPQWLAHLHLSSIWNDLFWPLNIIVGGLFVLHLVVLVHGVWQRWTACLELLFCVLLVVLLTVLLLSGHLITWTESIPSEAVAWANRTLRFVVFVVLLFTLWDGKLAFGRWRGAALER